MTLKDTKNDVTALFERVSALELAGPATVAFESPDAIEIGSIKDRLSAMEAQQESILKLVGETRSELEKLIPKQAKIPEGSMVIDVPNIDLPDDPDETTL